MEYDERARMRGEGFDTGDMGMEGLRGRHESGREPMETMRGTMHDVQRRAGQVADVGRESMHAVRGRIGMTGDQFNIEPRMMWIIGSAVMLAAMLASIMLFFPNVWNRTGNFLGEKVNGLGKNWPMMR